MTDTPPNADRIVQLMAQRAGAQYASLLVELALTQEALERAEARVTELQPDRGDSGG